MRYLRAVILVALTSLVFRADAKFRPDTVLSVLRWKDVVLASTRTGLFRGSGFDSQWVPLPLPPGTEPGGCLNSTDAGTLRVYYSPPIEHVTDEYDRCPVGRGLWLSTDLGQSWEHVDTVHMFRSVFDHADGVLYASAVEASDKPNAPLELFDFGGRAFVSTDGGRTWTATEGAENLPGIVELGGCAKDTQNVCATGASIRLYWMEYSPEQKKWTYARAPKPTDQLTPSEFFSFIMSSGTSPCCYVLRATLENYHRESFGGNLQKAGILVEPERLRYTFKRTDRKSVRVSMELLRLDPPVTELDIPDVDHSEACWGLMIIEPDGEKKYVLPKPSDTQSVTGRSHVLRPGNSYSRTLDLDSLSSMQRTGTYQVALVFDNSKLVKQNSEQWTGFLTGPPFQVLISDNK